MSGDGLNVGFGTLGPNDKKVSSGDGIYILNNTTSEATVTIAPATDITSSTECGSGYSTTDYMENSNRDQICTIKEGGKIEAGTTGWGYSLDGGTTFNPVFHDSRTIGTAETGKVTNIPIVWGISTDATVKPGAYSTIVKYTATTTDS